MTSFVYRVTGPTGIYIGKTSEPERRWRVHRRLAQKPTTHFHRALALYGAENFTFELIASSRNSDDALACERTIIANEKACGSVLYNKTEGGEGVTGMRHSEDAKARMSAAKKGIPKDPAVVARAAATRTGRKLSAEHIAKRTATRLLRKHKHTEEAKRRISMAKKGIAWSDDIRARMAKAAAAKKEKRCA